MIPSRLSKWPLVLALASGAVLVAQNPPQEPREPPIFRTRSDIVLVDFIATKDGRFVSDLTADDLEVFEDGKKQKISYFEAVDLGSPSPADIDRPVPLPEKARFAVLLDLGNLGREFITKSHRDFVAQAIRKVIGEQLIPGDLVMLAVMGRGGLRVPVPWTDDLQRVVDKAVAYLSQPGTWERHEEPFSAMPSLGAVPSLGGLADVGAAQLAQSEALAGQHAEERLMADVLSSIRLLCSYLRMLPGRKAVVFFTDGYRLRSPSIAVGGAKYAQADFGDYLNRAVEVANRADISFYTVDPGGMMGARGEKEGLHVALARDTGGLAYLGNNDLTRGLLGAYQESRRFYRLAYVPLRDFSPGKSHRIAIKTGRKGVKIRSRNSYAEPDPDAEGKLDVVSALTVPELFQQFSFEAVVEPAESGLTLHVRIPKEEILFRQEGEEKVAEVAFYALVFRDDGEPVLKEKLPLSKTYTLRFTQQQLDGINVLTTDHPLELDLKRGEYRLSVVVQQSWAQRLSARSLAVTIP